MHYLRRSVLVVGLGLLALGTPLTVLADEQLDQTDQSHVTVQAVTSKLELAGYSNVIDVDNNAFDAFLRLRATNPKGERVDLVLDNTTGSILIERPANG